MIRYLLPAAITLMMLQPALACEGNEQACGESCHTKVSASTQVGAEQTKPTQTPAAGQVTTTMSISGMVCAGCANKLSKSLTHNPAVTAANIDYEKGEATVTYLKGKITEDEIKQLIEKAGFKADKPQT